MSNKSVIRVRERSPFYISGINIQRGKLFPIFILIYSDSIVITIDKLILLEFKNSNQEKVIRTLTDHSLYNPMKRAVKKINSTIFQKTCIINDQNLLYTTHFICTILIKSKEYINFLSLQGEKEEKDELKIILSNIYHRLLSMIFMELSENLKQTLAQYLKKYFSASSYILGYEIFDDKQLFSLKTQVTNESYLKSSEDAQNNAIQIPSFSWSNRNENKFNIFLNLVLELKITDDIKKFSQLFNNPTENLKISLDSSRVSFVLQFFTYLKDTKLISYHNCKGFYRVLQFHVLDFDSVFLKGKAPKIRNGQVKKRNDWNSNYNIYKNLFQKLI